MTKIVATSDLHGALPDNIPECDVLIIAGDVCYDGLVDEQRAWLLGPFSAWLKKQPADLILGIGGNHDFALEKFEGLGRSLPWTYLHDSGYRHAGLEFWGSPWVPNLTNWAFHLPDHEIDVKYAQIPTSTDIVITHGPPHGYCDLTVPKFGSVHAGFPGTHRMLSRVRPKFLVCGHIHEGYGWMRHPQQTYVLNVAHQTENYEPIQPSIELQNLPEGFWYFPADFPKGNRAK